jgi:hypothetical protein
VAGIFSAEVMRARAESKRPLKVMFSGPPAIIYAE